MYGREGVVIKGEWVWSITEGGASYRVHIIMEGNTVMNICIILVIKPAKVQLIQPPMTIMGRTLVKVPFIISNAMFGSTEDKGWGNKLSSR